MSEYILAVDIGTSNVKCMIARPDMTVLAEADSEYETLCTGAGRYEQDPELWWRHMILALQAAAAKAGVTGERVDAAARKVISDAGYGDYFGHSFGHSLGLDIHEHPIAAPGVHAKLPEHTVISAEPGIYLPGKFGVRIEDVMHLTADGAEILTRSPKNLIIL